MKNRCVSEQADFSKPKATSGPPCTISTDTPRTWFCAARGRHWLILFQGQGARLLVCVMLRRQGLHPSSDSVQVPRALLWHREGSRLGAGTTWGLVCCSRSPPAFPRGELLLSCLRGPSPVHGAQVLSGLRGDLRRASCLLCSGDCLELG